jgi:hypothetical protein
MVVIWKFLKFTGSGTSIFADAAGRRGDPLFRLLFALKIRNRSCYLNQL